MTALSVCGRLLLGSEFISGAIVVSPAGTIVDIVRGESVHVPEPVLNAEFVAPGFIDLQVNGGFGVEVSDDILSLRALAGRLPETGVTAFLPTLVTQPHDLYARAFECITGIGSTCAARSLGFHLEGPWLSPHRPGAHRRDLIEAARIEQIDDFLRHAESIRLITVAPERTEILARIPDLRAAGVVVSLGHTDASFAEFEAGVDAGATMSTHLFNAMAPFAHREPNAAGAALLDDRVTVGLIADRIHLHPASVTLALQCKGFERVALVTDMVSSAGMPDGEYGLAGQRSIRDGASVRLTDGTLAGSVLTMDEAVRNVVRWGIPLVHALRMASEVPARVLGMDDHLGRFTIGATADLVLLDADLQVQATLIGGEIVYSRQW